MRSASHEFAPEDIATAGWLDAPTDYLSLSLDLEPPDEEDANPD
jgi:hypothetical protein